MPDAILIALIMAAGTVGGGIVGTSFARFLDRKKARHEINKTIAETNNIEADTANVLVEAAKKAIDLIVPNLAKRIEGLEKETNDQGCTIRRYGNRVVYLMRGIERLVAQIKGFEQIPVWTPEEWDPDKDT